MDSTSLNGVFLCFAQATWLALHCILRLINTLNDDVDVGNTNDVFVDNATHNCNFENTTSLNEQNSYSMLLQTQ